MSPPTKSRTGLYRVLTAVTALVLVAFGCLVVLQPFIPALLLAFIFSLSAWPGFVWLDKKLGDRTTLAALIVTVLLALCFLVPLLMLGSSMAQDFRQLYAQGLSLLQNYPAQPPQWIGNIPLVGPWLDQLWLNYAQDKAQMIATLSQYGKPASQWLLDLGKSIGHGVFDLSLGVVMAFFFLRHGEKAASILRTLSDRLLGPWGTHMMTVSKNTMIGIVYGILGTALVLGTLSMAGFYIAHVPAAPFLGLLTFLLGIIPGGPPFVLIPVTVWLFLKGAIGMGIFMTVWSTAITAVLDVAIRPYLISRGSRLPLLLVLLGVFGGVLAFGFIGVFIGPTLLAIAWAIVAELGRAESASEGIQEKV